MTLYDATADKLKTELHIEQLKNAQLQQQITELQARVGRLEQACEIYDIELGNMGISCPEADAIANETPAQSLAAIQEQSGD